MRRSRDVAADRWPDNCLSGAVAARSPFVCVSASPSQSGAAHSFVRAKAPSPPTPMLEASPSVRSSTFSAATTSTTASITALDASADGEDDELWALAAADRTRLLAALGQSLDSSDWRQRRASASEMIFDRRSHPSASASASASAPASPGPVRGEYNVVAKTTLACSVAELSAALSSDCMDKLNATLLALLGGAFAFAVTLRDLTPTSPDPHHHPHPHLSTKLLRFRAGWGPLTLPLAGRSFELLDFVDEDRARGRVVRVLRSLRRDACGRLCGPGDLLVGYELLEAPTAQHTRVFFFGATRDASALAGSELSSANGLLKLAKRLPKLGAIAVRRRFGARQAFADAVADGMGDADAAGTPADADALGRGADVGTASARSASLYMGADADACAACSEPLGRCAALRMLSGRKRHTCALCGLGLCGRCALRYEVEERIGCVDKRRICGECVTTLRLEAFRPHAGPAQPSWSPYTWSPAGSGASSAEASSSALYSRHCAADAWDAHGSGGPAMLDDLKYL